MPKKTTGKEHIGRRVETRKNGDKYIYERVTAYDSESHKTVTKSQKLLGVIKAGTSEMVPTRSKMVKAGKKFVEGKVAPIQRIFRKTVQFATYQISPKESEEQDCFTVFIPTLISDEIILNSLETIIRKYGIATRYNENLIGSDVSLLANQIAIYDYLLKKNTKLKHHPKVIALVRNFISMLNNMPISETFFFPNSIICELDERFLNNK